MDLTELLKLLGGMGGQGTTGGNPLQNLYYAIARLQGQDHGAATAFAQQAWQGQNGGGSGTPAASNALGLATGDGIGLSNPAQGPQNPTSLLGNTGTPSPTTQLPQATNLLGQASQPKLPSGPSLPSPHL